MIDMSTDECIALLSGARVGRLGMIDPDGHPYTIPLRFVWLDGAIYVRPGYDGRKQEAFEHQRRVCFETDECRDDFSHFASVIVEGTLMDLAEGIEKRQALVAFNDKYARLAHIRTPGPNPVTQGVAIRKIAVETLSGRKREPDEAPSEIGVRRRREKRSEVKS